MNEEILKILKMVEEGKITSDKGAELIALLKETKENKIIDKSYNKKMLKVHVESANGDKVKVNLPVEFIKNILNSVGNLSFLDSAFTGNMQSSSGEPIKINTALIAHAIENNLDGEIVNVNSQNGDIVRVVIE
ncbi:hypothetical protein ACAG39_04200 [Caldicellulosiruptoraceae bacterium PP1]